MKMRRGHKKVRSAGSVTNEKASSFSADLEMGIQHFMEYHSAKQLSRNLRKMLLEYLMHGNSIETLYLKELLYDIDGLFELLDIMETEGDLDKALTKERSEILR